MREQLTIKGKIFSSDRPIICVPIMEAEAEDIVDEAMRLELEGVEMIEWRLDAFSQVDEPAKVRQVLSRLRYYVQNTILLLTFRSKAQGGLREVSSGKLLALYEMVAASGCVDMVDVEYFALDEAEMFIENMKAQGVAVISSHHDFEKTPAEGEIEDILETMAKSGADIVKLAVMPESPEDVLRLLAQTNAFAKIHKDIPVVTMSMGKIGAISRISGKRFGSCITFGAGKNASAPGQIPHKDLKHILTWI